MDPERWRQVDILLQAVLERPAEEREAFLRNACGDDHALEREVRSLLIAQQRAGSFLDRPAVAVALARMAGDNGAAELSGRRLGGYQLHERIGVGGMGEVYRAHDAKLGRDVAIKILPSLFTSDPERLARFEREARVLASLNHPHIGAIYGVEDADGIRGLVLELVAGQTLADRIARGPVPVAEALAIARQIRDALDAAHEKGIVHRDLKPANIKLTPDGVIKVLDFGLAKAAVGDGEASDLSHSPTMMTSGTRDGVILGTAAYMSPEQARGKRVDKRSDIWAFGCVLYEMLTARAVFAGETISDIIAAILEREPDWEQLPARTPANIRQLLRRCLDKDPKRRLRDIGDVHLDLDEPAPAVRSRAAAWLWRAATALFLVLTGVLATLYFSRAPSAQPTLTFQIPPPGTSPAQMFTLAPDGKSLAFVASQDGRSRLWVRAMDTLDSRAIAGTDGASFPFWSPDGQHLGFFAEGKLKRIAVLGGLPQTICDAANGRGGTWNQDGVILFSADPTSPILRVPSTGGVPAAVTRVAAGSAGGHRYPAFLPDGQHFLYNVGSSKPEGGGVFVGSLHDASPVRLLPDVTNALYAPPAIPGSSGFLLFRRVGTLVAQPFDPFSLRTTGEMVPVAEDVAFGSTFNTFGAFSIASNGTLVYRSVAAASERRLVWVDRTGTVLSVATKPASFNSDAPVMSYSLSPDERFVVMTIRRDADAGSDLWLQDLERGVLNRFTFGTGFAHTPTWSLDRSEILFAVRKVGGYSYEMYRKSVAGSAREELLHSSGISVIPTDWSPDGQFIVFQQTQPTTAVDLWLLPLAGDRKPVPYLLTPSNERSAQFFPRAGAGFNWMTYQSDESNGDQIYVQEVPAAGAKYQISTDGGVLPRWRSNGTELFYLSPDKRLMAVPIAATGKTLRIGTPEALFTNAGMNFFVPTGDGQRFLIDQPAGEASIVAPITVVTNWQAKLEQARLEQAR